MLKPLHEHALRLITSCRSNLVHDDQAGVTSYFAIETSEATPQSKITSFDSNPFLVDAVSAICVSATLFVSPLVLPLAKLVHYRSYLTLEKLVDSHWQSLPAITQTILYDLEYRNLSLETKSQKERDIAIPPAPAPILSSCRVVTRSDSGAPGSIRATAFGWPTSGGLLVKDLTGEDWELVGRDGTSLDQLHIAAKPSTLPSDEDDFCDELRKLGARHYASIDDYRLSLVPCLWHDECDPSE
ncbi:MAG: hypothetical protein Q9159_007381 [Coniocarpon cinnabarinum]